MTGGFSRIALRTIFDTTCREAAMYSVLQCKYSSGLKKKIRADSAEVTAGLSTKTLLARVTVFA